MARNFSLGPARLGGNLELAEPIARGLRWLISHQNEDGTWGDPNPLDHLISTCHGALTLLCAGYTPANPILERAFTYLRSSTAEAHDSSYWRLAPLVGVPGAEPEVTASLAKLRLFVTGDSARWPNQLVVVFLMKVLMHLDRRAEAKDLTPMVLAKYTSENAWDSRADSTSHALAVLLDLYGDEAATVLPAGADGASRRLLRDSAAHPGPGQISWCGRMTSTSYTMMNIIESPLWDDAHLRALCTEAAAWIRSLQNADGSWPVEDPPYGGGTDLTSRCYYTAVAIRGLIAYGVTSNSGLYLDVADCMGRLTRAEAEQVAQRTRADAERQAAEAAALVVQAEEHQAVLAASLQRWRLAAGTAGVVALVLLGLWLRHSLGLLGKISLGTLTTLAGVVTVLDFAKYVRRATGILRRGRHPAS